MATKKPIVIVRSRNAGVHYGTMESRKGTEVKLSNTRRLWYWKGAASLSELAVHGVNAPSECKFSVPVKILEVLDACEILYCQPDAIKSVNAVPQWKA